MKKLLAFLALGAISLLSAAAIAAPDMTDATGSVTNVFGAVLLVAVLIFGFKKIKGLLSFALIGFFVSQPELHAAAIAAPDMTDATGSVTNVFGAVLLVAVLIFGFKKIKGLL